MSVQDVGDPAMDLLAGEAGIGKSRLMEQLCTAVADDAHTRMRYYCQPYHGNTPFYPVIDQMERAAGLEPGQDVAEKLARLANALGPRHASDETAQTLCAELLSLPTEEHFPPLDLTPQQRRQRMLEVLVEILVDLASSKPVLTLVEDAHWIDPSTNELMERAVVQAAETPMLVVIAARPDYHPSWVDLPHVTLVALNRLDGQHSLRIAETSAGGKVLPEAVASEILKRTDGVPLFVEELTKALLETDLLVEHEDNYELTGELPALAVPNTLRDSLMARLDRMGPAKSVAQAGAVVGRSFAYPLLAQIADRGDDELIDGLGQLVDAELMMQRGDPPDAVYTFKHALVQDTAYRSLLHGRRAENRLAFSVLRLLPTVLQQIEFPTPADEVGQAAESALRAETSFAACLTQYGPDLNRF
ncbi:MAG: AAA family ATPase, partial [Alphaproteobacteria bacterium]|nr:AAA family ATPase [Alphaproteobacteria bacterium]